MFKAQSCDLVWKEWVSGDDTQAQRGVLLSVPSKQDSCISLSYIPGWMGDTWHVWQRLAGRELQRREKSVKEESILCTLGGIFGDWSVQVNELVSMNAFHFMHEYRDSSLWIIVLAFDRKYRGGRKHENGVWGQKEMKCAIWVKCWGGGGIRSCFPPSLCTAAQFQYRAIRPVSWKSTVLGVWGGRGPLNCGGERKMGGWMIDIGNSKEMGEEEEGLSRRCSSKRGWGCKDGVCEGKEMFDSKT